MTIHAMAHARVAEQSEGDVEQQRQHVIQQQKQYGDKLAIPVQRQHRANASQAEQGQQQTKKIIRCVHSKHLLARAGFILRPPDTSTPEQTHPGDMRAPLLRRMSNATSPSTKTIGMNIGPEEADAMYSLSTDTEAIERFISHSWSAPGVLKWLALCEVYYRNFALGCAVAWWAVATSIGIGLRLQSVDPQSWASALAVYILAPALIFGCAFVHGPDALGSTCFLDKLCVHQVDPDLKLAGISCLADCLRASQNLTIVWSDDYFERLWCILEVAVFVSSSPDIDAAMTRITLAPLWLPPFLLGLMACNILVMLGSGWLQGSTMFTDLLGAIGVEAGIPTFWVMTNTAPALLMCWMLRRKSETVAAMLSHLATFTLDEAKVTVEKDRQIVYKQVEALFGTTENFEEYMRTKFYEAVVRRVGEPYHVRYIWAVIIFMPCLWYATVDVLCISDKAAYAEMGGSEAEYAELGDNPIQGYMVANGLYYAAYALIVNPLVLHGVSFAQRLSSNLPAGPALLLDVFFFQGANFFLNSGLMWLALRLTAAFAG